MFLFSNFVPIQKFSFLTALTVAVVNDLVLLPAVPGKARIITLWELLNLKLGKDPNKRIGIFEGCGLRKRRPANEGSMPLEASTVNRRSCGSSVARMRLAKWAWFLTITAAHVIATEDVEVLAVNEHFLQRMQQRYPDSGAKVCSNIAMILSDRLERA